MSILSATNLYAISMSDALTPRSISSSASLSDAETPPTTPPRSPSNSSPILGVSPSSSSTPPSSKSDSPPVNDEGTLESLSPALPLDLDSEALHKKTARVFTFATQAKSDKFPTVWPELSSSRSSYYPFSDISSCTASIDLDELPGTQPQLSSFSSSSSYFTSADSDELPSTQPQLSSFSSSSSYFTSADSDELPSTQPQLSPSSSISYSTSADSDELPDAHPPLLKSLSSVDRGRVLVPSKCFRQKKKGGLSSLHGRAHALVEYLKSSMIPDKVIKEECFLGGKFSKRIHFFSDNDKTLSKPIKIENLNLLKQGLTTRDKIQVLTLALAELNEPKFDAQLARLKEAYRRLCKKHANGMPQTPSPQTPTSAREISLREGKLPLIKKEHLDLILDYLKGISNPEIVKFITKDTCKDFLLSVKIFDLRMDRMHTEQRKQWLHRFLHTTYDLRELCLQASEGAISTVEAFTKSINPENYTSSNIWDYAMKESNYIPQRQQVRARLTTLAVINALSLSHRFKNKIPTTYLLRGNTAVGKTHAAKNNEQFQKGANDEGEIVGSLNPDTTKVRLIQHFLATPSTLVHSGGIASNQTHVEGCLIDEAVAKELQRKGHKVSMILDQRFGDPKLVSEVLKSSPKKRRFVIVDIDGPLILSALRVLSRDVSKDQCVPFTVIANGYKQVKQHRLGIIEKAKESSNVDYELFVTDPKGRSGIAAKKENGTFEIRDSELYDFATRVDKVDGEIAEVEQTVITDPIVREYESQGLKAIGPLAYEGHTIKDALGIHSSRFAKKRNHFQSRL